MGLDSLTSDLLYGQGHCHTPSTCGGLNKLVGSSSLASALLLVSSTSQFQPVDSFISFISLQSSFAWYMKLSQFETVFLGLVMLQISVLRYLEILPINVNNFFLNDPTGRRRKKRSFWRSSDFSCKNDILIQSLFKVLKKVDDGSCLPRTLCELESLSSLKIPPQRFPLGLPRETENLLKALKASAKYRSQSNQLSQADRDVDVDDDDMDVKGENSRVSYCEALDGMESYEEAVLIGTSTYYPNSTLCEERYSACPLTKEDIEEYIGILIDANIL